MSNNNGYIGKAKLRVGISRNGFILPYGSIQECTQDELDGGYFDPKTFVAKNGKKEIKTTLDNKSMSSPNKKTKGGIDK